MGYISIFVHTYIQAYTYILSMCNNNQRKQVSTDVGGKRNKRV